MRLPRAAMALMAATVLTANVLGMPFVATPAMAQSQAEFDVPAGRLSSSIRIAARQAGISIASRDAGVRRIRAKAVRGRMSAREALRQLLAGTPFHAVAVRGGYRIERRPVRRASAQPTNPTPQSAPPAIAPRRSSAPPPPPPPPIPIVVEGTKRSQTALDYPGGVTLLRLDDPAGLGGEYAAGVTLDEVLGQVPSVNGTALGSGRNKVFLRGIADSSFNGPTQSTIGMYLGEQKLVFSAPNPDLRLYDVESVELLEGPQGALYGAGTIAGLLRINPRAPDPSAMSAEGWASLGATKGGGTNWTLGAVGNVPISDASAVRVLAYSGKENGYLDDPARDLSGMNDSFHLGGRAALYTELGPDWSIELAGFGQHNELRDGQYIDESLDGLARTDLIAQPFRGRIYGGGVTVRGYLGDKELVSSTGMVDHNLRSTFDSSILTGTQGSRAGIQSFRESRKIRLINHETRLSGDNAAGFDWLVGMSALRNRDDMRQLITNLNGDDPPPFANVTYRLDEVAVFGEALYEFAPDFNFTGGARLLYTSAAGERSFGQDTVVEPRKGPARLLPAAALSWKPSQDWYTYLRYQQGFRTGGVTIERDSNRDPSVAQFDPDRVRSYEAGVRGQIGSTSPFKFGLTAYHSHWQDIQADFIDALGFPITRNIGDGEVIGVSGNARLETAGGWHFSMAGAWNDTNVDKQLADGAVARVAIPNVPDISGRARIAKVWDLATEQRMGLSLSGRYMGQSFVDIDQLVREEQGQYGSLDFAAWWTSDRIEMRIDALNLTNTRGNRFAFGNPFTARTEDQATPLRPRTIQIQLNFKH